MHFLIVVGMLQIFFSICWSVTAWFPEVFEALEGKSPVRLGRTRFHLFSFMSVLGVPNHDYKAIATLMTKNNDHEQVRVQEQ